MVDLKEFMPKTKAEWKFYLQGRKYELEKELVSSLGTVETLLVARKLKKVLKQLDKLNVEQYNKSMKERKCK